MASTYFRWPNGMAHFLNVPDDRGAWGRWGYRLFEGERDLDTSCDIDNTFTGGELELTRLVNQSDMLAPPDSQQYYKTAEYREVLGELVAHTRSQLDTGNTGNKLFDQFRAREQEPNGLYRMIIVGALMMRTGAKIRDEDIRYLRDLATRVDCKPGWAPPHDDSGFRGPGKAQFLAALDNYQAGTPRNFEEPSCFHCGKVSADIGKKPLQCGRCKRAWYCNGDCQTSHWRDHKAVCKSRRVGRNV